MSDRGLATVDAPWNLVEEWGGQGHVTDLGVPVHWAEFGTPRCRSVRNPSGPLAERIDIGQNALRRLATEFLQKRGEVL